MALEAIYEQGNLRLLILSKIHPINLLKNKSGDKKGALFGFLLNNAEINTDVSKITFGN